MTEADKYNGKVLAYVGDAVIELFVRKKLLDTGLTDTGRLSALALSFVTATAQSEAFGCVENLLDENELDIYRRGRNADLSHHPKRQKMTDYHRATGFEALIGYLYLNGEQQRADEILAAAYEKNHGNLKLT
jgi:ribonuclease-3 family protein